MNLENNTRVRWISHTKKNRLVDVITMMKAEGSRKGWVLVRVASGPYQGATFLLPQSRLFPTTQTPTNQQNGQDIEGS